MKRTEVKMRNLKRYLRIYWIFGSNVMSILFQSRLDFLLLFIGKLIVFGLTFLWLFSVFNQVENIAFYSRDQVILFFAVFSIIDRFVQVFLYRSLWFVQDYVRTGSFDKLLTLPLNSKFIATFRQTDWNEMLMLIPSIALLVYAVRNLNLEINISVVVGFIALCAVSIVIAYSLILAVAATSFRAIRVDGLYNLYRDLTGVSRFPPEVYGQIVSSILLFIIPVLTIVAVPSKFLLGMASPLMMFTALLLASALYLLSHLYWSNSIRNYTSASS